MFHFYYGNILVLVTNKCKSVPYSSKSQVEPLECTMRLTNRCNADSVISRLSLLSAKSNIIQVLSTPTGVNVR